MAVRISSMLLNAGRDDDRVSGLNPSTVITDLNVCVGGIVVTQDPSATPTGAGKAFMVYDGTAVGAAMPWPWGLLIEPKYPYNGGGASGDAAAGQGFDTLDYARGGLFSVFHRPGNLLDVYDDRRNTKQVTINGGAQNQSAPFVQNRAWVVGDRVYASVVATGQAGLLDNVNGTGAGAIRVGIVRAVNGSGADLILSVELQLQIATAGI